MGDSAQVEQESQSAPQTTADLIRATMSETYRPASRADIPLNGPDVILPQAATRTRPTRLRGIPRVPDSARAHDRLRDRRLGDVCLQLRSLQKLCEQRYVGRRDRVSAPVMAAQKGDVVRVGANTLAYASASPASQPAT